MNIDEEKLVETAKQYIKSNVDLLIEEFANDQSFPSYDNPSSVFMAGSPGAGKTEFSKQLIDKFRGENSAVVRIDPDEIRNMLPGYNGHNAFLFQGVTSIGVDKLQDYVLKYKKNFILDGTFTNYNRSCENVKRSINKSRPIKIYYIYQDPLIAWDFTKKREAMEGRRIHKEVFIEHFFNGMEVVNRVKVEFGKQISVDLIIKNYETDTEKTELNIDKIDNYLKVDYNREQLTNLLK